MKERFLSIILCSIVYLLLIPLIFYYYNFFGLNSQINNIIVSESGKEYEVMIYPKPPDIIILKGIGNDYSQIMSLDNYNLLNKKFKIVKVTSWIEFFVSYLLSFGLVLCAIALLFFKRRKYKILNKILAIE